VIKLGNYWLSYAGRNHITIGLPPTAETARDTVTPIEERRTDVTEGELAYLLALVKAIFEDVTGFSLEDKEVQD